MREYVAANKLSDKPSEMLSQAIQDLLSCETDPVYKINMYKWHEPIYHEDTQAMMYCEICLAGAAMARSLNKEVDVFCVPGNFPVDVEAKFMALDFFQNFNIKLGLLRLHQKGLDHITCRDVEDKFFERLGRSDFLPYYHHKKTDWYLAMQLLIEVLREFSL